MDVTKEKFLRSANENCLRMSGPERSDESLASGFRRKWYSKPWTTSKSHRYFLCALGITQNKQISNYKSGDNVEVISLYNIIHNSEMTAVNNGNDVLPTNYMGLIKSCCIAQLYSR